ncbi:MAG TPA: SPOR domain-containing protein, partial [Burkholderiales bacterium]|nr:SPOR domain-containing protein [Burkholderiales bacterium]
TATNQEKAVTPRSATPNSQPEVAKAPVAETATPPAPPQKNLGPGSIQSISKPNPSIVGTYLQKPGYDADALQARLAATENWLRQQDKNTHTIQLLGADNPQQLKHHLNVISKYVEINEIFVYRTVAKQKPSLTVLYGTFNDRQAARDALAQLPAPLKAYKPLLRSVQGIRAEIAQH